MGASGGALGGWLPEAASSAWRRERAGVHCGGFAEWLERHLAGGGMSTMAFASSSDPSEFLQVPHTFIWQVPWGL